MPRRKQARRMTVQDIRSILRLTHQQGLSIREELSLKVGDGGIGWHIKALLTRRSSRREKDMPHDEGYGCRVSRARRIFT